VVQISKNPAIVVLLHFQIIMVKHKREPLAIIGMGCKFPGDVNSPDDFWSLITGKKDALGAIPEDRWDVEALYEPEFGRAGKINVQRGGFIKDVEKFDCGFFGISPLEASRMDPQQRMLLEVAYEAIEDAGLNLDDLSGSQTSTFIGISAHDYGDIQNTPIERVNIGAHTNVGSALCIAANRISYSFNLRATSLAVDTACSSSLNAIHMACRSIWDGDAVMAFAGGVNSILKPEPQMGFSKGGFLSPDGICYSFDERGNGYIRAEGAGIIIIKPYAQAVKDNDNIYALIRGSAANQDGTTKGISVPSPSAQEELLMSAYEDAGVDPHKVQFVEAHGTGTFVGDPIEANSIGKIIGTNRKDVCRIGSVKSNVGHLEPASGIAGIIKLALAMKHETIPPNIHFKKGHPNIAFEDMKLEVPVESIPWRLKNGDPRYGGVNSFGFGGSNAHVVLEGITKNGREKNFKENKNIQIFTLSARSKDALDELARSTITYLKDKSNRSYLSDICYSASVRRSHHSNRLAIVATSKKELVKNLQVYLKGDSLTEIAAGKPTQTKDKIAFVFSGQGSQWWAMGRQMYETVPLFRETIQKLDKMLGKHAKWSLIKELTRDEKTSRISETNIAQPAIFAIQIALYEMWKAKGITPSAVVGHSIGEVAAGYASGALSLEQAVLLIFHRSRVQFKATDKGKMLAVGMSYEDAKELIKGREDKVSVGAVNGPALVALSGDRDVIEQIAADLNKKDVFNRLLEVNVPFHSHHMEPLKKELLSSLRSFKTKPTKVPFYSTVEGAIAKGEKLNSSYWFRNVREPVYFTQAIGKMIEDGFDTFLEIGPHPIHSIGINDLLDEKKKNGLVLPSLRRKENEKRTFFSSLGHLHCWGCKVDWKGIYNRHHKFIKLPRYPWQKETYWIESEEGKKQRLGSFIHPHLSSKTISAREGNNIIWDITLDKRTYPYIDDHKVQGPIVYPGAGHVDLAISAAIASFGDKFEFLEDLSFENALFLPDSGEPPFIQMDISHDGGDYFIYTKPRSKDASWTMCSKGRINHIADKFKPIKVDFDEVKKRIKIPVPVKRMHEELLESGLYLGPSFRAIKKLWRSDGNWESFSEIEVHKSVRPEFFQFHIHPGVLDSCFQTVFGIFNERDDVDEKMGVYVPVHIDQIKFYKKPSSYKLFVYGRLREWTEEYALGELWIFNEKKELVAEFHGFKSQYLKGSRGEGSNEQDKWFYEYNWALRPRMNQALLRNLGEYLPAPTSIKKKVDVTIAEVIARKEQKEYYEQYEPEQYQLTIGYICDSMKEMGMFFKVGTKLKVVKLQYEFKVIDEQARLFNHMFLLLKNAGIVKGDKGAYEVIKTPDFRDTRNWMDKLNQKYPQFHHESTLLGRCGPEITGVLQGTVDPINLIFPEDKWDTIVKYYVEGFAFKKYNDIAATAIAELLANVPKDQTIRILEIGAGTGGMTQAILPMLPADRTEYVFSDVSHMFLLKAQHRFRRYPFVDYKILDIEKEPVDQGFDLKSFDFVIASDVIHATRSLNTSLGNVQSLLVSGGILMMLEVTNSPVYLDFIFGMTEGWWLFQDTKIRPDHATMSPDKWKKVLEDLDYTDVATYSDFDKNDSSCQSVVLAKNKKLELAEDVEESPKPTGLSWLVFADDKGVAEKITSSLADISNHCVIVKKGSRLTKISDTKYEINTLEQEGADVVIDSMAKNDKFKGIIYAWGLDSVENEELNVENIIAAEEQSSVMLMNIMRKLNDSNYDQNPDIWLLSSGAQTVSATPKTVNLAQEGLRGVSRVVVNEFPIFKTSMVDFSSPVKDEEIDNFIEEIFSEDSVDEIAFRGTKRYLNRLERISTDKVMQLAKKLVPAEGSPFTTTISEYGVLDNILLREVERRKPADDEVEIQVKASALNFRDIMIAMGLLTDAAVEGGLFGRTFGLECAGVISVTGKNIKHLNVGDEVMATAPACIAGFAYPKGSHVVRKPKRISWSEAASLPVVYTTAYFSLVYHCRIKKGEKILIHAAAGGVGIAAIHIANAVGAKIYATVSSPKKRAYIESIGVKPENIMDSRTLEFADKIMELTDGQGVDIVLNSLSGEAIFKSIRCLAPYGRFVEIGKTDIYRNSKLGLQPFGNNLTYFGVDVDRLFKQKESFGGELFQESIDYFVENKFPVHPVEEFPISRLADAFQFMGGARHIGKIIISMKGEVEIAPPKEIHFKEKGTYLITGGASGFGLSVANWMTGKGAKHLVLMSRSGPKLDEEKQMVKEMRARGVQVMLAKGDVSDKEDVKRIFSDIKKEMPPLAGVQHAAMVLDDGSIPEIDHERYMKVFKPKAIGCWLLHQATEKMKLDHFVLYSSISAIYGNPGQVSYVGANSFLDNFAGFRRSQGLPAMTINWGVIGNVGFVARSGNVGGLLYKQGWKAFTLDQATDILEQMLLNNPVHREIYFPQSNQWIPGIILLQNSLFA